MGRKKKRTPLDKKGPLALLTFGDILKGLFMAVIIGLGLALFSAMQLTLKTMILLLIALFIGLIAATVMVDYAKALMK